MSVANVRLNLETNVLLGCSTVIKIDLNALLLVETADNNILDEEMGDNDE